MSDSEPDMAESGVELAPGVRAPDAALSFAFSRGSGPGGQNVNKVNTQAELRIAIEELIGPGRLTRAAAERLRRLAGSRLTRDDVLLIVSSEHRTQRQNRSACLDRLRELIIRAQVVPKKRKRTKPSRAAVQRRLDEKKRRSDVKSKRSRIDPA